MSWAKNSLVLDLIGVSFWTGTLVFLYLLLFRGLDLLPLGDDRRSSIERLRPLVVLVGSLVLSLFSAHTLFSRYPSILPIALLLVLVGFFMGSRALVNDLFAGIALRAEQSCEIGDHVQLGDARGRVTQLGPRAIVLETPEGDRVIIPYSQASRHPIVRTRSVDRGASRSFSLGPGIKLPFSRVSQLVEQCALLQHWGSVTRPPELTLNADGRVDITVFSLAEEHSPGLEAAIRSVIERAQQD